MKGIHLLDDPYLFLRKQSAIALLGFISFFIAPKIPPHWIKKNATPAIYFGNLPVGPNPNTRCLHKGGGATRWLNLPVHTISNV